MICLPGWPTARIDRLCRSHGVRIVGVTGNLGSRRFKERKPGPLEVLVDLEAEQIPGRLMVVFIRNELERILERPVFVKSLHGLTREQIDSALADCQHRFDLEAEDRPTPPPSRG